MDYRITLMAKALFYDRKLAPEEVTRDHIDREAQSPVFSCTRFTGTQRELEQITDEMHRLDELEHG